MKQTDEQKFFNRVHPMLVYVESLEIARKICLAQDLVETSLKRLERRRVPKTKSYKHNLLQERNKLTRSTQNVFKCIQKL